MKLLRNLVSASLLLCLIVVVLGAYVRLSDAGLGCPDWPGCYGKLLVPDVAHPDYERPLEHGKAWKEMIHRYAASTLGLLIVITAFLSMRTQGAPRKLPWFLVGLVIFQGLLGMWTVTLLLKPIIVTAHLLGGMSTLALLFWQWLDLRAAEKPAARVAGAASGVRKLAAVAMAVLVLQIFLGGWTSSNYAALGCPELPTCHGQWWPETDVEEAFTLWRGLGVNYEYGVLDNRARVTIHFIHRLGALLVTAVMAVLALMLWRSGGPWRGYAVAVALALGLQVGIALAMVALQMPLLLAAAHNAGAAVLLLVMIALNHRCWRPQVTALAPRPPQCSPRACASTTNSPSRAW